MQEEPELIKKSKSQVKREMQALRDLGKLLVDLPASMLAKFDLSDDLHRAILHAQSLKREALRRQLQHIGKLLRDEDEADIRARLEHLSQPRREEVKAFHQIELWRDQMVDGNDEVIEQVFRHFPKADRQYLMQLVRNARKEKTQEKPPKSARALFKYLAELQRNET